MSAIPTVKIKSKEHGFMWINECDLTDDMELYTEPVTSQPAEGDDADDAPKPTAKRKATAKG